MRRKLLLKQIIITTLSFFVLAFSAASQTKVVKRSAVKSNDYGINYYLPKTMLEVRANFLKIDTKAGIYYKYAEKYLGISNAVVENKSYYELDGIEVFSKGVPDKEKSYLVELKSGTTAPFVYLTENGLICTINAEYVPENKQPEKEKTIASEEPRLSVEGLFTEEYLQAGSTGKMAEIAAKQIYKIRESRMDILTGNADNVPKDGAALKLILQQLEAQEKALMELFTGTTLKSSQSVSFEVEPRADLEKEIIFRFSKYLGVVGRDDLSGLPVYMNLLKMDKEILNEVALPADTKKKDNKSGTGVVYNIPGNGVVEIYYDTNRIYKGVFDITQFGTTQILANPIFEDKKAPIKVFFYPETGAIKAINR